MASNLTVDTIRNSTGNTVLMEDGARKYFPGQVIQQHWFREGTITRYTAVATSSGTNWSEDDTDFGQYFIEVPARAPITPQFANSLIVCEWYMFGEPSTHDTGFKIAFLQSNGVPDASGVPKIIRRAGYEGYNADTTIRERNHYISDFYDGDNNSTGRMSNFMYFDKPNTTSEITYTVLFGANGNSGHAYTWNRAYNSGGDGEEAVSSWTIKEIAQ